MSIGVEQIDSLNLPDALTVSKPYRDVGTLYGEDGQDKPPAKR